MMSAYDLIYRTVDRIPTGKVATYGQIANLSGLAGKARLVGYALFRVNTKCDRDRVDSDRTIPWHRVVNAKGEISYSSLRRGGDYLQKHLLEIEGIKFNNAGKINLNRYQWL